MTDAEFRLHEDAIRNKIRAAIRDADAEPPSFGWNATLALVGLLAVGAALFRFFN